MPNFYKYISFSIEVAERAKWLRMKQRIIIKGSKKIKNKST